MTFIITAISSHGVWQCSDRRLMDPCLTRVRSDAATKTIRLGLEDGKALISYAGIGSVKDREVSDWMKRLFRGRKLTLRQARNLLAAAATRRITIIRPDLHEFSIAAMIDNHPELHVVASNPQADYWKSDKDLRGAFGTWSPRACRRAVYFSGGGRAVLSKLDQRLVVRTLDRSNLRTEELEAILVHLNRKVSKKAKTASYDCICSHINPAGGGWSHLHTRHGWKTLPIPTVASGLAVDDIAAGMLPIVGPELAAALREQRKPKDMLEEVRLAVKQIDHEPDDLF